MNPTSKKDIAHVAIQGTAEPHAVLPGTEGDSDNQKKFHPLAALLFPC